MLIIFHCLNLKPQTLFKINSLLVNITGLLVMATSFLIFFIMQKGKKNKNNKNQPPFLGFLIVDVLYSLSSIAMINYMYYKYHSTNSITDKVHEVWSRHFLNNTLVFILYSIAVGMVFITLLPIRLLIIILLSVSIHFSLVLRQYIEENLDRSSMPYVSSDEKQEEKN